MFKGVVFVLAILLSTSCGTGIGNPEAIVEAGREPNSADTQSDIVDENFDAAISQYQEFSQSYDVAALRECGSLNDESLLIDLETSDSCIRQALSECAPARHLRDSSTIEGGRIVSFIAVEPTESLCQLRVHTVSSDTYGFFGDEEKTCTSIDATTSLQYACGIGE